MPSQKLSPKQYKIAIRLSYIMAEAIRTKAIRWKFPKVYKYCHQKDYHLTYGIGQLMAMNINGEKLPEID